MSSRANPSKINRATDYGSAYDLNCTKFNPDEYLNRALKEESLMDLIEHEAEMIHQIKALDTEMQTLVYDNYNKFITATDTIRRMKSDFIEMEQEMSRLNEKIEQICTQSGDINENLEPGRKEIRKFTSTLDVMKRFKFLFELPAKLREFIDKGEYRNAAVSYTKAFQTLRRYSDNPSFKNIFSECQALTDDLREKLYEIFRSPTASTKQLAECLELFSMLEEPSENLYTEFLSNSELRLKSDLELLEAQLVLFNKSSPESGRQDLLEFIDTGTNGFLSNLCLIIASYNDMFLSNPRSEQHHAIDIEVARLKVTDFAQELMARYFECISKRISYEDSESSETEILVRAMDRFYRRLQAMKKLINDVDFSRSGLNLVKTAASNRCEISLNKMCRKFDESLLNCRETVAASANQLTHQENTTVLITAVQKMESSITEQYKTVLYDLQGFTKSEVTFSGVRSFTENFVKHDLINHVMHDYARYIFECSLKVIDQASINDRSSVPPGLLLVLSRINLDLGSSILEYAFALQNELFIVEDRSGLLNSAQLSNDAKSVAEKLLNFYSRHQGNLISQMICKSLETRDWLNSIEPRHVRAAMKRVVEDITSVEVQVAQVFEEGNRQRVAGSSSSRPTRRSVKTSRTAALKHPYDTSLMSNIQRMFSDKIEIFSQVDFSKFSVMTAIIKMALKTFLESVRLRTFGKFGLQQIQVDIHYLEMYLWRFVSDEHIIHSMLDDIVNSAVQRCVEPELMEQSVVEMICEGGV